MPEDWRECEFWRLLKRTVLERERKGLAQGSGIALVPKQLEITVWREGTRYLNKHNVEDT